MSDVLDLMERSYDAAGAVVAAVPADRWDAESPCAGWTVWDVTNHLVGVLTVFAAAGEHAEAGEVGDDTDNLGSSPATAFHAAARRCLAAFSRPGALDDEHPFAFGPTRGLVIARIGISESLVHGWDIAKGVGVAYEPDPGVVSWVAMPQDPSVTPPAGAFAPPVPTPQGAPAFTELLGRLGRKA